MKRITHLGSAALLVALLVALMGGCGGGGTTYVVERDACDRLRDVSFTDIELTYAVVQSAADGYPLHCKVQGRTLSGRVGFELRMPLKAQWNGRLLLQGTGGYSGQLDPALGSYRSPSPGRPGLLASGYAVATTDTGHTGAQRPQTFYLPMLDGSWAFNNPVAEEDFAWRGTRAATVAAQAVLKRFQQSESLRTYYVGCSGAGRIGMKMAEKASELYDGFAIGDPTLALSEEMRRLHWSINTATVLPLPQNKLRLLADTVMQRCDALDGAADGVVSDPEACRFNPFDLQCSAGDAPGCLTQDQAITAWRLYAGPVDDQLQPLGIGLPPTGSEDCSGLCDGADSQGQRFREGWAWWMTGGPLYNFDDFAAPPKPLTTERVFGTVVMSDYFQFLAFDPDTPNLRWQDVEAVTRPSVLSRARALYDVQRVDFSDFRSQGKRILLYQGWGDALVSPLSILDYYRRVQAASGGETATRDVFRLFMVPAMQHCEGGRALDNFDAVGTLVDWVEKGAVPQTLRATSRFDNVFPGRQRDLCAYPLVPVYRGTGSHDDPAAFECRRVR